LTAGGQSPEVLSLRRADMMGSMKAMVLPEPDDAERGAGDSEHLGK
jgi:hypothetical protein